MMLDDFARCLPGGRSAEHEITALHLKELRLRTCHIAGLAEDTKEESIRQRVGFLRHEMWYQLVQEWLIILSIQPSTRGSMALTHGEDGMIHCISVMVLLDGIPMCG